MKGLQFFGNRVEDAANAFIDVLKYSDQSVTYPDFKDIDPYEDYSTMNINPTIEIGSTWEQALKIALNSEIETIGHYKKIQRAIAQYEERSDYNDVNYFLEKLIANEEHHMKLLKEAMGMDKATKGVTVIIK
jgi:bacterioferritin (cytochrome b1)